MAATDERLRSIPKPVPFAEPTVADRRTGCGSVLLFGDRQRDVACSDGEVKLCWRMPDAAGPATYAGWLALLDPEEAARAARFHHEPDRRAYVAAHALKRAMLAEASGLSPSALRWTTGPHGRPELHPSLGLPELRFSITHSRGLVACGITRAGDIGVDTEPASRKVDALGLARQVFAPEEAVALAALPESSREGAFIRLWTLKEAFVKASGEGLSFGLDRFALQIDPVALAYAPAVAGPASTWRFMQFEPVPGHVLSIAFRKAFTP